AASSRARRHGRLERSSGSIFAGSRRSARRSFACLRPTWIESVSGMFGERSAALVRLCGSSPKGRLLMDRAFIGFSKDGPAAGVDRNDRSRRCSRSEVLVHYFLDDLSSTQKRDLTDHLSGCDLCSARLLALEISAAVGLEDLRSSAGSIIAGREPK